MAILENIRELFTSETARNKNSALISGFLFFTGWWVLIDAMSVDSQKQITTGHVFIGVFGTISFFMVNTVKNSHISEENTSESGARIAKIYLLIGFVMGFASIIAAIWVMIDDFINNKKKDNWPGVALLMQNVFILIGSLVYKFGRNEEDWNE
ncbi:PREDICTED: transmembrane protein 50A [Bactrocera latifrons]|uniref:Transmembrane protein 50A n=1 Tax=Bactrocera latifrons TaxID=174628 RepID=A0A0K8W5H5_BACLA|nr:PREDICTED: transmembrane protein 50A [Bactrocera latifrons]